jgi:predicted MFS family arabinose efflux permease
MSSHDGIPHAVLNYQEWASQLLPGQSVKGGLMANPYHTLFTTPGVTGLMISGLIARLPQTMIGIGIVTMLVQQTRLYWLAASAAGTFTLAHALIGPYVSRVVDQWGQRKVLPFVTVFSIGMLFLLIIAVYLKAPFPLLFIFAALAGTMPSMPAMTRARWAQLFHGKAQLHTAFCLDMAMTELAFIIGPPLAIGLSISFFTENGPLISIFLLFFGMTAFLMQRQTEPTLVVGTPIKPGSILLIPGIRTILSTLMAMGIISGSINVAVFSFAFTHAQSQPAPIGFILVAHGLGSMIAALLFGVLSIAWPIEKQFSIVSLITATITALPFLSSNVYIFTGILFVAGLSFALTMVIVMKLGTIILPPSRITEGFTRMTTDISIGIGLGGISAGLIIDAYGVQAGFGVAFVAGLAMVMIMLLGLRTLRATLQF